MKNCFLILSFLFVTVSANAENAFEKYVGIYTVSSKKCSVNGTPISSDSDTLSSVRVGTQGGELYFTRVWGDGSSWGMQRLVAGKESNAATVSIWGGTHAAVYRNELGSVGTSGLHTVTTWELNSENGMVFNSTFAQDSWAGSSQVICNYELTKQ